ncbi:gamma-mobile-trio protein GmtX [Vibrio lentus]|uniref:gamma-mobile-trio protein GmtX n=1 Tax=Vibrio lentus TaxID=136468 RepID=UPI00178C8B3D|nr:gamma-mobile-trio protein GmtX [Vibrio lentus]MDN3632659.1 gamma-mobile-trio protein GmtX [Vibrio lentus]
MSTIIEAVLERLCSESSSSVETKLRAIHKIIQGFKRNNVELTAPNLTDALMALGIKMSKSSIYNKKSRGKDNPYRVLVDAWQDDINDAKVSRASKSSKIDITVMSNSDYESITSDLVKFKIQNMYNELKSARHQVNLLKEIQGLPIIQEGGDDKLLFHNSEQSISSTKPPEVIDVPKDSDIHIEVIEDFLENSTKVMFDEDGCLVASKAIRKSDLLSDIGLQQALSIAIQIMKNQS